MSRTFYTCKYLDILRKCASCMELSKTCETFLQIRYDTYYFTHTTH